ncbi:MAG: redoxin domain-containing protein [Candidatus Zixiibacteriota bacterium]
MMKYILFLLPILLFALSPGEYVPAFELSEFESDATVRSFDIFKDEIGVIIFWSTYCDECIEAFQSVNDLYDEFQDAGIEITTINTNHYNELEQAREIAADTPYKVLYDNGQATARQYDAYGFSYIAFILGNEGRILEIQKESVPEAGQRLLNRAKYFKKAAIEISERNNAPEPANIPENPTTTPENEPANDPANRSQPPPNETANDTANMPEKDESIDYANQPARQTASATSSRFSIAGNFKLRYQYIALDSAGTHGAYGEPLSEGSSFKFLCIPDLKYRVSDNLHIGSVFRMTNISNTYLLGAPDYFTNNYFSPYILYRPADYLNIRAGYFRSSFTPLVLMRWDSDDNPPGAGGTEGGCATCEGLAGGVSSENLEELGPELGFEGLKVDGNLSRHFSYEAFYARAQTLDPRSCGKYLRNMGGLRFVARRKSNQYIGINSVVFREEAGICSDPEAGYNKADIRQQDNFSVDGKFAFLDYFDIFGEIAYSHTIDQFPDTTEDYKIDNEDIAYYFGAGIQYEPINDMSWNFDIAYQSIGEEYLSSYKALSYLNDRKGLRLRSEIEYKYGGLIFFMKKLDYISEKPDSFEIWAEPQNSNQLGYGAFGKYNIFQIPVHLYVYITGEEYDTEYQVAAKEYESYTNKREIITSELTVMLTKQLHLQIMFQNISENEIEMSEEGVSYRKGSSNTISSYMILDF